MEAANLESLANELKGLIIEYLEPQDSLRLSATCRSLRAVAEPAAYDHITVACHFGCGPQVRLIHLMRTLVQRPDLAKRVRSLDLRVVPEEDEESSSSHITINDTVKNVLLEIDTVLWESYSAPNASIDVTTTAIMAVCIDLESVSVPNAGMLIGDELDVIIKPVQNMYESGRLAKWKKVLVKTDAKINSPLDLLEHWKRTLLFLHVPTLEHLEIRALVIVELEDLYDDPSFGVLDTETIWPLDYKPSASNLTTLRMVRCSLDHVVLPMLFKSTPNLRNFEFECVLHPSVVPIDLDHIEHALSHVQLTLTKFKFRLELLPEDEEYELDFSVVDGSISSLEEFPCLTDLEISLHTLYGPGQIRWGAVPLAGLLPPKLERLTITDDLYAEPEFENFYEDEHALSLFGTYLQGDREISEPLHLGNYGYDEDEEDFDSDEEMKSTGIGQWREATPNLKKFVYDIRERACLASHYWGLPGSKERLLEMCKKQGIEGDVLSRSEAEIQNMKKEGFLRSAYAYLDEEDEDEDEEDDSADDDIHNLPSWATDY